MAPQRHAHSKSFGVFNPCFGTDKFGFHDLKSISYNFDAPLLYEEAIRRHEGVIARGRALVAETGVHTGRSPRDKFIVADAVTEDAIWWDNSGRMSKNHFDAPTSSTMPKARKSLLKICMAAPIPPFASRPESSRSSHGTRYSPATC